MSMRKYLDMLNEAHVPIDPETVTTTMVVYDPKGIMNGLELSDMIAIGSTSEEAQYLYTDARKSLDDDTYDYMAFFYKSGGDKVFELKRAELVDYLGAGHSDIENAVWTTEF